MTEPTRPADLDATLLDEGRERRGPSPVPREAAALARTVMDSGRARSGGTGRTDPAGPGGTALPEPLARRYKLVRPLAVPASQADLFLMRDRATGEEVVLKRYRTDHTAHPQLQTYLSTPHDHVVRYLELGPGYEVMEHLPGGSLLDWRDATPTGFDFATLRELTQQLAAVLISLHRRGLAHRDIKPANILLRSREPLDLAVVDFGAAGPADEAPAVEGLNPAYQPPEVVLRDVRPPRGAGASADWWGLGMTLVELAAAEHPFEGLTAEDIRAHFAASRVVDVSGVPDEPRSGRARRRDRLRSLCRGLLTNDWDARWGAEEVSRWLAGQDPSVPVVPREPAGGAPRGGSTGPVEGPTPEPVAATRPYVFNGVEYHARDQLAAAMADAWEYAVTTLFGRAGQLDALRDWLEQFTDADGVEARRVVEQVRQRDQEPGHVRLLRVLRALQPTLPATYRNHVISRRSLRVLAHRAMDHDGDARSVLSDLFRYRLLPTFDTAAGSPRDGGQAFADLDRRWRAERRRWYAEAARIADPEVRRLLRRSDLRGDVLAVTLRAALRHPDDVAAAHEVVHEVARELPVDVPWFTALTRRPELVWVALPLAPYARSQARTEADRRAARAAEREARRAEALFREWSRRQSRPVALGWAVAGVCLLASVWIALITASDAVGWADDAAVGYAWVGASVCAAASLTAECLLAAEAGALFHRWYSIPRAGAAALRPLGARLRRTPGVTAAAVFAAPAVTVFVALRFPQAVAAATTVVHLLWVAARWRALQARLAEEDALVREATGPSDTDDAPVGATRGVDA